MAQKAPQRGIIARQQTEIDETKAATKTLQTLITSMGPQIAKALPSILTPERFTRMILTAVSRTPKLVKCTRESFLGAVMQAAQLGLEPNTPLGQAYLIPYYNKGRLECQFQLGYKGLIDLAYRSGAIKSIQAHAVHENDTFGIEYGLEQKLKHVPALRDRGEVIGYYAVFHTTAGGYGVSWMSVEDARGHANRYSKSVDKEYSPWQTNFDEMAKKTVVKKALKYAPVATEFARDIGADETIKHADAGTVDALDTLDMTDYKGETIEAEPEGGMEGAAIGEN